MSKVRNPTFTSANNSTHICGSSHQRLAAVSMSAPQGRRIGLQLHHLLQHRIVAVPLHEVSSAHESAMLAGASIVMPEIEVHEIDWLREGWSTHSAIFTEAGDQVLSVLDFCIRVRHHLFRLR